MNDARVFPVPSAVPLYHITDVANLKSILAAGGLTCLAKHRAQGIGHTSIADPGIQEKRARTDVPCGPKGTLHDYVPLFFCTRPPMLYTISRGNVQGRQQKRIIYLCTTIEAIGHAELRFVFTDGHGIMQTTQFFSNPARLDRVDWPLMTAKWWNTTQEQPDRTRRRQAEFLVHGFLPWDVFAAVAVQDVAMEKEVVAMMEANGPDCSRPVHVLPVWYY